MKNLYLIKTSIFFLTILTRVYAQAPIITACFPLSGPIGTTVIINGSNFNTNTADNTVFFGTYKAQITAATATQLTVKVPGGNSELPISVLNNVNHLTGYSSLPFSVTLTSTYTTKTNVSATDMGSRINIPGLKSLPNFADIDGDGKADMILTNSNVISVLRNTSANGVPSYSPPASFTIGAPILALAIGDLDGDGKPEIVVTYTANGSNNCYIAILHNVSTSGSINAASFESRVDILEGANNNLPYSVCIGDIDGDGKPDIGVANVNEKKIAVYHNICISGSITTSSFESKLAFDVGTNPNSIRMADLNGDGKADIITVNNQGHSVSILRNKSVSGSVTSDSFAPYALFFTDTNNYPTLMGVTDIDGDGKPDIVTANMSGNNVTLFTNTSLNGSITLGISNFFIESSAVGGQLADINGDGKPDVIVFLGGSHEILQNTAVKGNSISSYFAKPVNIPYGYNPPYGRTESNFGDIDGDGKPDIIVHYSLAHYLSFTNVVIEDTVYVFRNIPLPPLPKITSFSPISGVVGSSVTITGNDFDANKNNNIVYFGATRAVVNSATGTQLVVTVPVGASHQSISVTNTISHLTVYSTLPFLPRFWSFKNGFAPVDFDPEINFNTNTAPYSVIYKDVDGDGKADMLVTNAGSNTISVYRNISLSGILSSSSFGLKTDFVTGVNPTSLNMADIDGDGKADMLVTNYGAGTISVFRNTSVSGDINSSSFADKVDFIVGDKPLSASIYDINGDGKPDVAIANVGNNTVSILKNTSVNGVITVSSFAGKVDLSTGINPVAVSMADLNGDRKPELITANYNSNTLSVFTNISTVKSDATAFFSSKTDLLTGTNPFAICTGDLNGDGFVDLTVANKGSNTISTFLNYTNNTYSYPIPTFSTKTDITTGKAPVALAIGDIDGDGMADIAVANYDSNTISLLRNNSTYSPGYSGILSFGDKQDLVAGIQPNSIAIGDIDGDGKPDITAANFGSKNVSVFRNDPYSIPPVITSVSPVHGPVGSPITITGTNFNAIAGNNIVHIGTSPAFVSSATINQLIVSVPKGAIYQPISILNTANNLTGYSDASFGITFTSIAQAFDPKIDSSTGSSPYTTSIADIDGDGLPDVVVANAGSNTISVFRNISTGKPISSSYFAPKVDFATGVNPSSISIGDLNGDGKPEIIVTNYGSGSISIFTNNTNAGIFTTTISLTRTDITTSSKPASVKIADIDGNGAPDLLIADPNNNTITLLRNLLSGNIVTPISFAPNVNILVSGNPDVVNAGDLDGDGKPDLITANYTSGTISVYRNTSILRDITADSFAPKVDFAIGNNPFAISVGDIDGDGKLDLAIANKGSNTFSILHNMASPGSITNTSFMGKVDFTTGLTPQAISMADVNGDGKTDILVANYDSGGISLYYNKSSTGIIDTASFTHKFDIATGNKTASVNVADMDGDGKPDIIATNFGSNTISIIRNNITVPIPPSITTFNPATGPIGTTVIITGDNFDNTASNNIVFFGATMAAVTASTKTQLTVIVPAGATYQPISVTVAGLTTNSLLPFVTTLNLAKTNITPADFTKAALITGYNVADFDIKDMDGDGKPDLVVVNQFPGNLSIYRNISTSGSITPDSFASTPIVSFLTNDNPASVHINDIDGDGKPDIILTYTYSTSFSIFRNKSVAGSINSASFATQIDFTVGATVSELSVGDADGDGKPDIIISYDINYNTSKTVIYRNLSTIGNITPTSFSTKMDLFFTGRFIGDINGDGKTDMGLFDNNQFSILQNTSDGYYRFAPGINFATGTTPIAFSIGDLDGDGKPDIAIANSNSNSVSVLHNISSNGTITSSSFAPKVDFATSGNPNSIAIGDINGDGKPDMVVTCTGSSSISVLRNNTTTGIITSTSFDPKIDIATTSYPHLVHIGDLDGDGKSDIITTSSYDNKLEIFRNNPDFDLPVITLFSPSSGPDGTVVNITGDNFNNITDNNIVFFGATKAVVNASTPNRLTVEVPTGATYQPISVLNTSKNLAAYSEAPFITTFSSTSSNIDPKVDFTTGSNPDAVTLSDVDGDGKPDMITINYNSNTLSVYRNISSKGTISATSFADKIDFPTGANPTSVAFGDIDGDGKPDIVVTNSGDNSFSILHNTSTTGSITNASFAAKISFYVGGTPVTASIADIDNDGKPEVIIFSTIYIYIFINNSTKGSVNNTFAYPPISFYNGYNIKNFALAVGDIDSDGRPDILATNNSNNTISLLRNTTIYKTITNSAFDTGFTLPAALNPNLITIGDIDGDGKPDVIVVSKANTLSIYRNTSIIGSFSFETKTDFAIGAIPKAIAIGDINGDGKPDILLADSVGNKLTVYYNSSSIGTINATSFTNTLDLTTSISPVAVSIGDIDGDGKPDLLAANYLGNTISVFKNNPNKLKTTSLNSTLDTEDDSVNGLVIHPALSPNGDGINDVLIIDEIQKYPNNSLTIMNSNGTKIYEISGYNNTTKVFDGHSNITGLTQKAGTYFYVLEYKINKKAKRKTGYLIIKL